MISYGNVPYGVYEGCNNKGFSCSYAPGNMGGDWSRYYHEFGDRFIPMQCTGLKDKNDKLIYEGDIISMNNMNIYSIGYCDFGHTFTLDFKDCYGSDSCHYFGEEGTGILTNKIEVLGNVYENKELMEKKK